VLSLASLGTAVLAATEGEEHNPLLPETNELIWGAVAFLVLFAIMSKVAFPSIQRTLAERSSNIEGKLEQAERERQEAQRLLAEYKQRLDDAHQEARRLVEQARTNADRLETELRAQAEDQAARIIERAQDTINAERERAMQSLRNDVGGLAVDLAARIVGESLDRDRQLRLVDQFLAELDSGSGARR
jgi:F-type H+-transporting ATPase subunit b